MSRTQLPQPHQNGKEELMYQKTMETRAIMEEETVIDKTADEFLFLYYPVH